MSDLIKAMIAANPAPGVIVNVTNDEARTIAIEAAAIAMRNATDRAAVGLSMRARRDLAAQAYDAILQAAANDLRHEGARLRAVALETRPEKSREAAGIAVGLDNAARFLDKRAKA